MKYFVFAIAFLGLLITGCKTDVELNAPYKSTTVVYALLDPVQDTQWIKINRTFLGDGNNLDYALVRDSSEYDFSAFKSIGVSEIEDGHVVNTYALQEKEVANKSINGIFYGPEQTVYYFVKNGGLNQHAVYRLDIDFHDLPDVTAQTALVQSSAVMLFNGQTIAALGKELALTRTTGPSTFQFDEYSGSIVPDESAPFYEVALRMNFTEKVYTDASHTTLLESRPMTVEYYVGRFTENNTNSAGRIPFTINGLSFFDYLGRTLKKDDHIVYQIGNYDTQPYPGTECFDIVIYFGGTELYTYYQVNSPSTGVVQERPTYSNVQNGLGLWSSRSSMVIANLPLVTTNPALVPSIANILALRYSTYTIDITFCDPGSEATDIIPACAD